MQRALAPKRLVAALEEDRGVAVLAHGRPEEAAVRAGALVEAVTAQLAQCPGCRVVAGVGRARSAPAELPDSADEAAQAARVASVVAELGPVGVWEHLGAYRTIERLAAPGGPAAAVPDALERLLGDGDAATLVPTLEAYLDSGGDAQSTSARLLDPPQQPLQPPAPDRGRGGRRPALRRRAAGAAPGPAAAAAGGPAVNVSGRSARGQRRTRACAA